MFYSAQRASCFSSFRGTLTNGFSLLLRAKCDGQMWLLKGLKAQYRDDFVYQELLHKVYNILSNVKSRFIVIVYGIEIIKGYGECFIMVWMMV